MNGKTDEVWGRVIEELGETAPPGGLRAYVDELVIWGERIHLTGRERMAGAIAAQIVDSFAMLELAGDRKVVADIGAGAGFPGIIWKLARPGMEIVIFERKERLASFLARTAALLGMKGISIRAEDAARYAGPRRFDVVTSKAAGRLEEILPIAGRMLRKGGIYVTAKGGGWEKELGGIDAGFSLHTATPLEGNRGEAVALVLGR
jgi:16S rRNA (guanine527-N7)-methyltransferase